MKGVALVLFGLLSSFALGFGFSAFSAPQPQNSAAIHPPADGGKGKKEENMKLGAFSVSLNVKDILVSKQFYENLGFTVLGGDLDKNYLIMKNENALIGLFQGMFEGNILTFNPGWDENGHDIKKFDDIREIQGHLKSKNIALMSEADEKTSGPASLMLTDPDGNVILMDQHR